tara:strand:+ start:183 stop:617 length:435 start_codon:yes stop_codon:yes gene_type:complete
MDIKIDNKTENKLLSRLEVKFTIKHKGATPSRTEVQVKLAAKLSKDSKLVIIPKISTRFGLGESIGIAHVYKTEKAKLANEPKHILKRFEPKPVKTEVKKEEKVEEKASEPEKKEEATPAEEEPKKEEEKAEEPAKTEEEKPAE